MAVLNGFWCFFFLNGFRKNSGRTGTAYKQAPPSLMVEWSLVASLSVLFGVLGAMCRYICVLSQTQSVDIDSAAAISNAAYAIREHAPARSAMQPTQSAMHVFDCLPQQRPVAVAALASQCKWASHVSPSFWYGTQRTLLSHCRPRRQSLFNPVSHG